MSSLTRIAVLNGFGYLYARTLSAQDTSYPFLKNETTQKSGKWNHMH
jgi:hypothetical protein